MSSSKLTILLCHTCFPILNCVDYYLLLSKTTLLALETRIRRIGIKFTKWMGTISTCYQNFEPEGTRNGFRVVHMLFCWNQRSSLFSRKKKLIFKYIIQNFSEVNFNELPSSATNDISFIKLKHLTLSLVVFESISGNWMDTTAHCCSGWIWKHFRCCTPLF